MDAASAIKQKLLRPPIWPRTAREQSRQVLHPQHRPSVPDECEEMWRVERAPYTNAQATTTLSSGTR
jgi:hypothetical protein